MDVEKMREVLATKCTGWHRVKYHGVWSDWYDDQNKSMCLAPLWQPDRKWDQCGMVIEAMARKRFLVHMSIYTCEDGTQAANATCSRFTPGPSAEHIHATSESLSDSIPLCACEAMARALEATDG